MIPETLPESFFDALGNPLENPFSAIDDYRFEMTVRQLGPGSVLDVGAYYGDFLKLARKRGHAVLGTEVNEKRVELVNALLGANVVRIGFRNAVLDTFDDASVDNVVCTEVVEHVPDREAAVHELCRVARRRVIITVPFREKLQRVLCVHCSKHTPLWGHFHAFDLGSFHDLAPAGWSVTHELPLANKLVTALVNQLPFPRSRVSVSVIRCLDAIVPGPDRWLLVVLERTE